ncbi:hypothetical protein B0H66DRAFT_299806 [Apodospora peruviana]|uniref:Uncharacterized protein n=1 Tax=Apodospora peruviana TaxID=516989 RepID=A0AAE0M287_9PEZI|nr:hypothetical protein B0H66DRAFT_299806 [Apodospora peruviana]
MRRQHHNRMAIPSLAFFFFLIHLLTPLLATAVPQFPPGAEIQEDTGQVSINGDPTGGGDTGTTTPNLPIKATIFSSSPGPKSCRGHVMLVLDIPPPPQDRVTTTAAQCYNMPAPASCGNFVANKEDGCEVRLFAEENCRLFMNTAVFIPEERAVGGLWRSLSVRCGIPPPDPATLGAPPLQDIMRQKGMGLGRRRSDRR